MATKIVNADSEPARPGLDEVLGTVELCLGVHELTDILSRAGLETFLTDEQQSFVDGTIDGFFAELGYARYRKELIEGREYKFDLNKSRRRMMIALMRRILAGKIPSAKSKEAIAFAKRGHVEALGPWPPLHVNEFAFLVNKLLQDDALMQAIRPGIGRNHDDEESQSARIALQEPLQILVDLHSLPRSPSGLIHRFLEEIDQGHFDSPLSSAGLEILRHHASFGDLASVTFEGDSNV